MMNANLCEIFNVEIIAINKKTDLQSIREIIENFLFQNLIRNLECKKSKIRIFECNEDINVNVSH